MGILYSDYVEILEGFYRDYMGTITLGVMHFEASLTWTNCSHPTVVAIETTPKRALIQVSGII